MGSTLSTGGGSTKGADVGADQAFYERRNSEKPERRSGLRTGGKKTFTSSAFHHKINLYRGSGRRKDGEGRVIFVAERGREVGNHQRKP